MTRRGSRRASAGDCGCRWPARRRRRSGCGSAREATEAWGRELLALLTTLPARLLQQLLVLLLAHALAALLDERPHGAGHGSRCSGEGPNASGAVKRSH